MEQVIKLLKQRDKEKLQLRVKEGREGLEELANFIKLPKDVKVEHMSIGDMAAGWFILPNGNMEHFVLYLHGGGYIQGSIKSHQDLAARIARASKTKVLVIDYRLAPENPYPAALEDAVKAYKWLINDKNISPDKIIIAGDSAGGGLTLCTLIKLRDEGLKLPAAAVCLSPWTDLAITSNTIRENMKKDPWLKLSELHFMSELYIGDNDPTNPLISPLFADLNSLCPLLIHVGTNEIILDDSIRFAEKAKKAGNEVTLEVFDDMIHVFQAFAAWAPEGQEAINKIGEYIQAKLN